MKNNDQTETDQKKKPAIARFFGAIGRWIKKHKGLVIFLVIAAVAAFFVIRIVSNVKKAAQMFMNQSSVMTVEVKSMDLSKTVSVTGTLEANDLRTVKAAVSEAKIATINVEVGDYVNVGDTIMTYDSEDLKDNLEDVEKQVNLDNYKTDYNIENTYNKQEDQQWTHDRQLDKLNRDITTLRTYYTLLVNGTDEYKDDDGNNTTVSGREYFEKHMDIYYELNALNTNVSSYVEYQKSSMQLPITKTMNMEGEAEYDGKYEDVVKDYAAKLAEYEKDYIEFLNQNDDRLGDTEFNRNVAAMQGEIDHDKTEQKLKEARDDLDEMIVKAPISGIVTSISVEEGDTVYSSAQNKTTLCVIQDTSAFKVTGSVDEYDIALLSDGQRAVVKTDSTGDEEFPATLTFVAPTTDSTTSTSSASSSGSSAASALSSSASSTSRNYEIKLSLDRFDDRLRVGMTAKTSIILDEMSGVLAVPYDCVQTDNDGSRYVNVITDPEMYAASQALPEDGKKGFSFNAAKPSKDEKAGEAPLPGEENPNVKKTPVEIVFESDYYIAIKGEGIKEGTVVEGTASSGDHDLLNMMMGGGPGGGGPGGPGGM